MYLVFCDGGSRGNPGNAAIGIVIKKDDKELFAVGEYIGVETNNVAEYEALIWALKKLEGIGADNIKIHLDSELVVKQINRIYKVKNLDLQKRFTEAMDIKRKFENIEVIHVRREFNKEADALVNMALDKFEKDTLKETSPNLPMSVMLQNKVEILKEVIKNYGSIVIGYSGGIDSSLLSYVASRVLGDKALAITLVGAQSIKREIDYARNFTKKRKINHLEVKVDIMKNEDLMKNTEKRCYYCKLANFYTLKDYAKNNGYEVVADGGNIDDLSEYRPGLEAIKELDIRSPFIEAGMTKKDIKELSAYLKLELENRESNTCLITRIPIHSQITENRLKRVDACEGYLVSQNLEGFRVRDLEDIAVIELKGNINISEVLAKDISKFFKKQGYKNIYIDIDGYKRGAMSEKG